MVVASYYGGHGASGYRSGSINMVAGQRYKVIYRGQEYGGGEAFYFMWYRPVGVWGYWNNEITNVGVVPTKQARINFDFGSTLNKTTFAVGSALSSTGWVDVTNALDSNKISNGYKATITPGQVEWSLINPYEASRNGHRLQIDERVFPSHDTNSTIKPKNPVTQQNIRASLTGILSSTIGRLDVRFIFESFSFSII